MIKLKAFGKLNLNLHIIPNKLKNGFYPVSFINCQIELHDEILIEKSKKDIEIVCQNKKIPTDNRNNVFMAISLLKNYISTKDKQGIKITIKKNIPVKAGFGGGSTDTGIVLNKLIEYWKVKISKNELKSLINKIGKEVFYCIKGGLCSVEGDGSIISSLKILMPELWLVIVNPKNVKPSTKWMYENLQNTEIGKNLHKLDKLKSSLLQKDKIGIINNLFNDFENLAINKFPIVDKIKRQLICHGALNTLLAGSGLSTVGFFENKKTAQKAFSILKTEYNDIYLTKTI